MNHLESASIIEPSELLPESPSESPSASKPERGDLDVSVLQEVIDGTLYDVGIVDTSSLSALANDREVQERYYRWQKEVIEDDGLNFRTFLQNRLVALKQ